jgi:cbb3-type cytochrome c oxidase subunit III
MASSLTIMSKNKYLLLISSLGVLVLLVVAIVQENFRKDWRRIQQSAVTEAGPVEVRLRQTVVPALRVTDRCVTCHVGMSETGVSGSTVVQAHKPVVHDPAEFGCTTCHGGQGAATDKDEAHGNVHFWPEPMIPTRYAYAGCGSCHTHLQVTDLQTLEAARTSFERADCLACHRMDGRGGTIRPFGGGMEGPDLSTAGASGYDTAWYDKHLEKWQRPESDVWRESFGPLSFEDRQDIELYLGSRVGAPGLVEAKAVFHSVGCRGCHKINGVGGDDGPDLSRAGEKDPGLLDFTHVPGERTLSNWIAEHFRFPARLVPGSLMPAMDLNEEQIEALTFYTLSLRRPAFPDAYWPKDRIRAVRFDEREFAADGKTLYNSFCSACHGLQGQGNRYPGMDPFPAISNPDFLRLASDEFITETVQRGRPGTRMPPWGEMQGGLHAEEVAAVVAYVRELGGGAPPEPDPRPFRWAAGDAYEGQRLYGTLCSGCHGAEGAGGQGNALNNEVLLSAASDTYLAETIARGRRGTTMEGFHNPSPVRPALSESEIESLVTFIRSWKEN